MPQSEHNTGVAVIDRTFTRRQFMIYRAVIEDKNVSMSTLWDAIEGVHSWAIENPDVDMDEEMSWADWQARGDTR